MSGAATIRQDANFRFTRCLTQRAQQTDIQSYGYSLEIAAPRSNPTANMWFC